MNTTTRNRALCLILSLLPLSSLLAQWQEMQNIYGRNPLSQIEETTHNLVGISDYKVYIANKTDYIWEQEMEFNMMLIHGMTTKNDTIYIVYSPSIAELQIHLKVSFDEGNTWQESQFIANSSWGDISAACINNQIVLAGNINGQNKIFKSTDLGQTWESSLIPDEIDVIQRIADKTDSHILFDVDQSSALEAELYVYSLNDNTWILIPPQTASPNANMPFILNNRIYWANDTSNLISIYSSALDGSDVQTVYTMNSTGDLLGIVEINGSIVFNKISSLGSTVQELYVSNDFGQTFELQTSINNSPLWNISKPLASGECIIFSSNLYLMSQDFSTLSLISSGFIQTGIHYLTSMNDELWVGVNSIECQRSIDNGLTFEPVPPSMGPLYGGIAHQGDTLFYMSNDLIGEPDSPYGYRISFDNGLTSEEVLPIDYMMSVNGNTQQSIIYQNKFFLCLSDILNFLPSFILISNDFGETWENTQAPGGLDGDFIECNNSLYFFGGDLYRFNESNNTWTALNSPIMGDESDSYSKLRVLGNNIMAWNQDGQLVIYFSEQSTFNYSSVYMKDVAMVGNIAYGLGQTYLYSSADFGLTWQSTGIPVPIGSNYNMISHNGSLYVYGDIMASVWKLDAPQVISGIVYHDANANGAHDQDEFGIPQIMIHSQSNQTYAMSGPTGAFSFNYSGVEEQFTVEVNNPAYTAVPQNFSVNAPGEINIGIQIQGAIADLLVDAIPLSPFRPGFSTSAIVHIANLGNVAQGGILFVELPNNVSLTSSSIAPVSQAGNSLEFSVDTLQAFESGQIQLNMLTSVNANLGDPALFSASLTTAINDINTANNQATDSSIIVGAYDPNDKACDRGELVTPDQLNASNEFEYLIRFQNTGSYYAENVIIKDTISSDLDLSSLRIIAASDSMLVTFNEGNLLNFNFPLIFLPDSTTNEPESHGFVKYAIRTKPDIQLGSVIKNTAYIYFDFNEPIVTNTTETLYDFLTSTENWNQENFVQIYPNPTRSSIRINEVPQATLVSFTDLSGKQVLSIPFSNLEIDLSSLNPGIYLGSIIVNNGATKRFKVIKL